MHDTSCALWQCPRPATSQAFPPSSKLTLSSQSPSPITVYGVTGIPSYAIVAMRIAFDCEGDPFNGVKNSHYSFFQGYVSLHVIVAPSKQDTSPIEPSFLSGAAACVQVTRQQTKPRAPRSPKLKLGLCAVASLTSCRLIPSGQSNAHRQTSTLYTPTSANLLSRPAGSSRPAVACICTELFQLTSGLLVPELGQSRFFCPWRA